MVWSICWLMVLFLIEQCLGVGKSGIEKKEERVALCDICITGPPFSGLLHEVSQAFSAWGRQRVRMFLHARSAWIHCCCWHARQRTKLFLIVFLCKCVCVCVCVCARVCVCACVCACVNTTGGTSIILANGDTKLYFPDVATWVSLVPPSLLSPGRISAIVWSFMAWRV